MKKIIKRFEQKRRIKKINQQIETLSWNMQFESLTQKGIEQHNKKIASLKILKNIEEGLLEFYLV